MPSLHCQPWQHPLKTTTHAQTNSKRCHNTTNPCNPKLAILHKAMVLDKAMAMHTCNTTKRNALTHPPTTNALNKFSPTAIGEKAKS